MDVSWGHLGPVPLSQPLRVWMVGVATSLHLFIHPSNIQWASIVTQQDPI